jgi:predicted Zn finger-like uncharacterized protein
MKRTAMGDAASPLFLFGGSARQKAEQRADERLEKYLKTGHDMVPCPTCRHYQKAMTWSFKKRTLLALPILAAIVLLCSWFIPSLLDKETKKGQLPTYVWPPGLVVGIGIIVYAVLVFAVYDPNTLPFRLFGAKKGTMHSPGTIPQPSRASPDAYASQLQQMPAEEPVELPPPYFVPGESTASDIVAVRCPHCDSRFHARSGAIGKRVKCKRCGQQFEALEDLETA